jgi:DeoR/GlpR family transcriptional regulator of sugar metabolism
MAHPSNFDYNRTFVLVKEGAFHSSDAVILMLDSSKFGKTSLASIIPIEEVDILVTSAG